MAFADYYNLVSVKLPVQSKLTSMVNNQFLLVCWFKRSLNWELHCDKTRRPFEKTKEIQKTRATSECFLHFSSVLNVRSVLSQCNARLRLLHLLCDIEVMWRKTIKHAFSVLYSDKTWVLDKSAGAPGPIYNLNIFINPPINFCGLSLDGTEHVIQVGRLLWGDISPPSHLISVVWFSFHGGKTKKRANVQI